MGHPATVMVAESGGLVVTGIALFLLLRPMEIMGAALASLLGYAAVAAILIVQSKRLTGASVATLLCPTVHEMRLTSSRVKALVKVMAQ